MHWVASIVRPEPEIVVNCWCGRHSCPNQAYRLGWAVRIQREGPDRDGGRRVTELDVAESIVNAVAIYKRLRSRSPHRGSRREYLYVIQSTNLEGVMVYSKGKLIRERGEDHFYFLISSKRAL
jgi:hypothetical protein